MTVGSPHIPTSGVATGLSSEEALRRLREVGPNALPETPPVRLWRRFFRQFRSPFVAILLFAVAVDLGIWVYEGASGFPIEAAVIAVIPLANATLGTFQEYRSEAAVGRLRELRTPQSWVLRDGRPVRLPSRDLVPGDLVRIEAGDRVPADGRMTHVRGVLVDESVVTGESVAVEKGPDSELLAGTLIVRGSGYASLTRTGAASTLGRLAAMLGAITTAKTPLEQRLDAFAHKLTRWVIAIAVLFAAAGLLVEGPSRFEEVFFFAVALAVAAIPEGLPAVVTVTLALGVERIARRKAVVRRLSAVEALGSVTVIATDKTGTLTENRLETRALDGPDESTLLAALVLANDAEAGGKAGDPLETSLIEHARKRGMDPPTFRDAHPRISGRPFDSEWKFMRATVREDGRVVSYLKGAPEAVLDRCTLLPRERAEWTTKVETYAREGYRVLAAARGNGEAEDHLVFLGLALLWDPPRPEVPDAIRSARAAGIRVVMITGDHPSTARAVARAVGIDVERVMTGRELEGASPERFRDATRETNVFARVSPEDKLRIVEALKADGHVVAVTGDGVNDAPALKRADVGVAMGQRGSEVAREVSDLVLLDDNFATIVTAIEEGRSIYENIQKSIRFLLSTNLAMVLLVVGGAVSAYVVGLRTPAGLLILPLTAIQILWINLVTDGPPALALGTDRNPSVMERPPRAPKTPLLDAPSATFVLTSGIVKAAIGLGLLVLAPFLGFGLLVTRTLVFAYEALAQLTTAYPARRIRGRPLSNVWLHAAVLLGASVLAVAIAAPGLRGALGLAPLDIGALGLLAGALALTWLLMLGELRLMAVHKTHARG